MRRPKFGDDKFYHLFNRGVEKRDIFLDGKDFVRFIKSMREFNVVEPIGSLYEQDILKYKIKHNKGFANPSRVYETLGNEQDLKERENDKGIRYPVGYRIPDGIPDKNPIVEFISYCLNPNHYHFLLRQLIKGGISEFMRRLSIGYTNYFNQKYNRSGVLFQGKFKAVEVKNYSRFLKLIVYVNCNSEIHKICKAEKWPWSSYLDCVGKRDGTLCNKEIILNEFSNPLEFKNFCIQVLPDIIETRELKQYLLE